MSADTLPLLAGHTGIMYRLQLETELTRRLRELDLWTSAPDEDVDWALEALLDDVRRLAIELRALRNEASIPF